MNSILMLEVSNVLLDKKRDLLEVQNRELMYDKLSPIGYKKTKHFLEFPVWINHIYSMFGTDNIFKLLPIVNIEDTISYINDNYYDYIVFSCIEATSKYIAEIIENIDIKGKIIIGLGEGSNSIKYDKRKVKSKIYVHKSIDEFKSVHNLNKNYTLNRFPEQDNYIPRYTTSKGCNNNCSFCTIANTFKLLNPIEITKSNIKINPNELVYLDNKTFIQGGKNELISLNHNVEGYIVQTSVNDLYKNLLLINKFIENKIKVVELGIETFNASIRETVLNKHFTNVKIETVVDMLYSQGIHIIFNLMIGIIHEDKKMYDNTLNELNKYKSKLTALNITNYTDYKSNIESDRDESISIKSWHNTKEAKNDLLKFKEKLYRFNYELLTNFK